MEPFRPTTLQDLLPGPGEVRVDLAAIPTYYRLYRFGGKIDYTVGDHLLLGYFLLMDDPKTTEEQVRQWLCHEQFESTSGCDLMIFLKQEFPWYIEAENSYLKNLYEFYNLDYSKYAELVKPLDEKCALLEIDYFFNEKYVYEVDKALTFRDTDELLHIFEDYFDETA